MDVYKGYERYRFVVIGHSSLGAPIDAIFFAPPEYARQREAAAIFGGIHGDEPASTLVVSKLVEDLLERPPGRPTWLVPLVNPDGMGAGTKNNARDVDLNRNFAASNWAAEGQPGYGPGAVAESEPETQAVARLIAESGATRLIAVHATFRVMNWDGTGQKLAEDMASLSGYPASDTIGYLTPGSFGSKYGRDLGLEVVTVEVPYLDADLRAFTDIRAALHHAIIGDILPPK